MTLKEQLTRARAALRDDEFEGRSLFEELLDQYPNARSDLLRERSLGYAEAGAFDKAFADRRDVADADMSGIADLYFAGEYAMQAGSLAQAAPYFERCIARSLSEKSAYYLGSARLLAALCLSRMGDKTKALAMLDEVPADVSVMWLDGFDDEVTKASVLKELRR
ncbi:MAG: tetratricopeptide repeat protein [Burkholderiales bacterium]|jgi:tetratricopeptide (TPR) repeat protein|nr:tetratricopeptide repeat protein [Novosphingobium sp.]